LERARWTGVRAAAARAALALAGTVAGLLAAELATRVTGSGGGSANRSMFFDHDPDVGWRCRPHLDLRFTQPGTCDVRVRCNSRGLRDREHAFEKPAGVRRVVCVGDSYAWGQGVEDAETFASVLERALPAAETINLGVAGYTAVQELLLFEAEGVRYAPDWTVVLFCDNDLDSDFDDKELHRPRADLDANGGDALRIVNRPVAPTASQTPTEWIHRHSRLVLEFDWCVALMRERRDELRAAARAAGGAAARTRERTPAATSRPAGERLTAAEIRFSLVDRFLPPDERMDQAWRTLGQIYARLRDDAAEHGSRLLVAYVPDPPLALAATFGGLLDQAGIAHERADWDRPGRRLAELCRGLGVACVDLAPAFRSAPDPARLFLNRDPHWSAAGADLAARTVAARLRELDPGFASKR